MPVPASEPAEGLQTPEVNFVQNEHYGCFDGGKMDEVLAFFANDGQNNNNNSINNNINNNSINPTDNSVTDCVPYGSMAGAKPFVKFDPEVPRANLAANESTTLSAFNDSSFNPLGGFNDDLLNNDDFRLLSDDEILPYSSQEMNQFGDLFPIEDRPLIDCEKIGMSIEEQNDAAPATPRWPGTAGAVATTANGAAFKPVTEDKLSQFFANPVSSVPVHTTQNFEKDTKPDIVQNAFAEAMKNNNNDNNNSFTAEELSGATIVYLQSDHNDPALTQYLTLDTIDPSELSLLVGRNMTIKDEDAAADAGDAGAAPMIPQTVQRLAEPVASTSSAGNGPVVPSAPSISGAAYVDAAVAVPTASAPERSRKRKAPSSVAEDDDWTGELEVLDYAEKRRRNNMAVRKSRAAAKEKQKSTEAENEKLKEENEKKSREIEILQREVKIYKELFERSGFALPRK